MTSETLNNAVEFVKPFLNKVGERPGLAITAGLATAVALRAAFKPKIEVSPPAPLPTGVTRIILDGPNGALELLKSEPAHIIKKNCPPLLLVHGGFGNAAQYNNWLTYLSHLGFVCYSLSLTAHGMSEDKTLSLEFTRNTVFESDLVSAIDYVTRTEEKSPVLVGHSAGGGLSQAVLSSEKTKVSGLIPLAAFPCFGGSLVYKNWMKQDPWYSLRWMWDLFDIRSALSTPTLVHGAFFSKDYAGSEEFSKTLNRKESILWPLSMLTRFVDVEKVKKNAERRVFIVGGSQDKLMSEELMKRMAQEYGCELAMVEGSGHMVMIDNSWKEAADVIAKKMEQWFPTSQQ